MTLRFAYARPDGGVSVVVAASKASLERVLGPLTDVEYVAHVKARSIPRDATNLIELPDDWSQDRSFRDAWTLAKGEIGHDMAKAREIHRQRMRSARAPLLKALDIEYQRADEDKANPFAEPRKAAIVAKKQALRDVTEDPAIDAAKTPDELKAVWPSALG